MAFTRLTDLLEIHSSSLALPTISPDVPRVRGGECTAVGRRTAEFTWLILPSVPNLLFCCYRILLCRYRVSEAIAGSPAIPDTSLDTGFSRRSVPDLPVGQCRICHRTNKFGFRVSVGSGIFTVTAACSKTRRAECHGGHQSLQRGRETFCGERASEHPRPGQRAAATRAIAGEEPGTGRGGLSIHFRPYVAGRTRGP